CPIVNCTCSVTQWKQWSSCNEFICTDKPQNRVRSREIVEFCRQDHLHEMLSESEPCPLPSGCDQLEKFHESNVGLVMNV
uniref:Uncharacterized protein n=1 Tax=Romanomermis culicivorax TaxID=13658 RepID=A0A915K7W3_ROMCU